MDNAFTTVDLIGWAAALQMVFGVLLVARKRTMGWLLKLSSTATWLVFAVETGYASLIAESLGFFVINTYGLVLWWRSPPS